MNKLVAEQLKKVQFANLDNYDESTKEYTIPKLTELRLEKNKSYLIRLKDECFDKKLYININ